MTILHSLAPLGRGKSERQIQLHNTQDLNTASRQTSDHRDPHVDIEAGSGTREVASSAVVDTPLHTVLVMRC